MFTQTKRPEEAQRQPSEDRRATGRTSGEPSIIEASLKVIGDLHSAGNIQINGTVEGDIICQAVTIGEGAHVQGKISAETVRIFGSIEGQVKALSVTVAKTAKMLSDIVYRTLSIEAGAFLEVRCRHMDPEEVDDKADISAPKPAQTSITGTGKTIAGGS